MFAGYLTRSGPRKFTGYVFRRFEMEMLFITVVLLAAPPLISLFLGERNIEKAAGVCLAFSVVLFVFFALPFVKARALSRMTGKKYRCRRPSVSDPHDNTCEKCGAPTRDGYSFHFGYLRDISPDFLPMPLRSFTVRGPRVPTENNHEPPKTTD
jgi:hypothetical protein